jgi:hypothetical protein
VSRDEAGGLHRNGVDWGALAAAINEEVISGTGYKRPPVETQFKKGTSGNPAGRPRKAKPVVAMPCSPLDADRRAEFSRPVKLRAGDKEITLTVTQAVLKAQSAAAMRGNPMAQRTMLQQAEAVERRDAQHATQALLAKEACYNDFVAYRKTRASVWDKAFHAGVASDEPYPLPEDFVLDAKTFEARIDGPIDEEHLAYLLELLIIRDRKMVTLAHFLDLSCFLKGDAAALYSVIYHTQKQLPKRWRLSAYELVEKIERLAAKSFSFRQRDANVLGWMIDLLDLPETSAGTSGETTWESRQYDAMAKRIGFTSFAAMCLELDRDRRAETTRKMKQEARERLETLKRDDINVEMEWQRRKAAQYLVASQSRGARAITA